MRDYWTHLSLSVSVDPATEPVTPREVAKHARVETDVEDAALRMMAKSARQAVEGMIGRALITQTLVVTFPGWPEGGGGQDAVMRLPMAAPLGAVSTVQYYSAANVLTTWGAANYNVESEAEPALISRAYGVTWPTLRARYAPVRVTYTAGYGTSPEDVPEALRLAICAYAAGLYEFRESHIESAFELRVNAAVSNLLRGYMVNM